MKIYSYFNFKMVMRAPPLAAHVRILLLQRIAICFLCGVLHRFVFSFFIRFLLLLLFLLLRFCQYKLSH